MLYIVGTPIGNLQDVTLRAIETLRKVDVILAEDTRRTKILLDHYGISISTSDVGDRKQLVSFHEHSSPEKIEWIIRQLKSGKDIALVCDAGMPGLADPGGKLVEAIRNSENQEIGIMPIPGVSALVSIMSVSGVQNEPCLFLGYLPKKKGRQTMLKQLGELAVRKVRGQSLVKTIVIFESPQRIQRTIKDLYGAFGAEVKIVVGRELTKQFEEISWMTVGEAYNRQWPTKGEYVFLVSLKEKRSG